MPQKNATIRCAMGVAADSASEVQPNVGTLKKLAMENASHSLMEGLMGIGGDGDRRSDEIKV